MICLGSTIGVDWEQAAMDELFADLQSATSVSERQEIVSQALNAGLDQGKLREMLDYLEVFEKPSPKCKQTASRNKGNWAAFISSLIYRCR